MLLNIIAVVTILILALPLLVKLLNFWGRWLNRETLKLNRTTEELRRMKVVKCANCEYFDIVPTEVVPSMDWTGDVQHAKVIEHDHEGFCSHEANWMPGRGDMPCDMDYRCKHFIKRS